VILKETAASVNILAKMKITRFRSVWGIDSGDNLDKWANWFPDLKKQGYSKSPQSII
jgi:hypothetical protein